MRTKRSRRGERGAAMVEAAIIAACMVIELASMWAAMSYERAKLQAMDEARVTAWAAALQPCDGSESTLGDLGNETANADSDALPSQGESSKFLDLDKTSLSKDSGYVDVTKQKNVVFPKVIGGQQFTMKAHMYMRCNEPKPPENLKDFFKTAFGVLKSMFGF
jgi:hypothetical protein